MVRFEKLPTKDQTTESLVPFESAEEAWLWFIQAQEARNAGARFVKGMATVVRPCEPLDILKILDRLYRQRFLLRDHLLVLRHYGRRLMPPDKNRVKEMRAHKIWTEALERIEPVLIRKGIVAPPAAPATRADSFWHEKAVLVEGGLAR